MHAWIYLCMHKHIAMCVHTVAAIAQFLMGKALMDTLHREV